MLSHSIALYKNLQKRYSRRINLDLARIKKVLTALAFPHLELENPKLIEDRGRYHLLLINKYEKYPQELKNIKQGEMLENIKARNFY